MTTGVPLTNATGQFALCEMKSGTPIPSEGVIRVRSIDPKFDSSVLEVEIDADARVLTTLLRVSPKS
jgi:hypothetical protein